MGHSGYHHGSIHDKSSSQTWFAMITEHLAVTMRVEYVSDLGQADPPSDLARTALNSVVEGHLLARFRRGHIASILL